MKKNIALTFFFTIFSILAFSLTKNKDVKKSVSSPTLCQCLTAPGGNPSMDKPKGCKQVILKRYGTTKPSMAQMKKDYYNCQ